MRKGKEQYMVTEEGDVHEQRGKETGRGEREDRS